MSPLRLARYVSAGRASQPKRGTAMTTFAISTKTILVERLARFPSDAVGGTLRRNDFLECAGSIGGRCSGAGSGSRLRLA